MVTEHLLRRKDAPQLERDQEAVMTAYLERGGRVCVGASAGTGKTTVLIETLAEVVLREFSSKTAYSNPLDRTLAITFGVEASREIKTRIKQRFLDHQQAGGEVDPDLWKLLESESHIETIDAFLQSLLRKIVIRTRN